MRLSRLVDDFQRLAAAQRPGLLLDKAHVDLTQLVRSRARAFESSYAEKGIDLMVDVDPAYTLGDAERLGQVVDNLLSNALRYTDAGGRVVLRLIEDDGHVLIEVADTGMGIPKEQLPRIFDRFWRSDMSRSRATGGSGLGLALVRELVVAHDGRVDVLSAPGHGSRFRVFLPRAGRQYVPAVRFSHVPVPEAPGGEATVASVPADLEPDGWARVERDLVSAVGHGAAVLVVVVPGSGPLDPSGVAALLAVSAQLKARGGRLAVVREDRRSTPAVRGLDDVLFVEDVDAALAQLAA
jgi:two-component sensor histidine kinase